MIKKTLILLFLVSSTVLHSEQFQYSFNFASAGYSTEENSLKGGRFYFDVIENYLVHQESGIGLCISPFYVDYDTNSPGSHTSLLNLSLFHKSIYVNPYSIFGPYLEYRWYGFERNEMDITGGLRFSWMLNNADYRDTTLKDKNFTNLFEVIDLRIGCRYYRNSYSLYSSLSIDMLSFLMLVNFAGN